LACGGKWLQNFNQVVESKTIKKLFESWSQEEIKKVEYDAKAMNIIHSSLNCDEFFKM